MSGAGKVPRIVTRLPPELRYLDAGNIAKDFTSKRERAAIAAVLEWVCLNGVCAWPVPGRGQRLSTKPFLGEEIRTDLHDSIVIETRDLEYAERVLAAPPLASGRATARALGSKP